MKAVLAVLVLVALTAVAKADNILVFGGDQASPPRCEQIAARLRDQGHTVTLSENLPSTGLASFDAIYHTDVPSLTTDSLSTQAARDSLVAYVKSGGGLMLSGEWSAFSSLNSRIGDMVRALLGSANSAAVGSAALAGKLYWVPNAIDGINESPEEIGGSTAGLLPLAGETTGNCGCLDNVPGTNKFLAHDTADGAAIGAAFGQSDMQEGNGHLIVIMDAGWDLQSSPTDSSLIDKTYKNMHQFLRRTGPPPPPTSGPTCNCDKKTIIDSNGEAKVDSTGLPDCCEKKKVCMTF